MAKKTGKWTKAAKLLKTKLDIREAKASDLEILITKMLELPPGQLKKVLSEEVMTILEKYGVSFDE